LRSALAQKGFFLAIIPALLEENVFRVNLTTHQEAIMALDTANKTEIIKQYQRTEGDTGSSEVQIALLSTRIAALTEHLKVFKKDHSSRLGLLKLVGQRRRLMRYLKRTNRAVYNKLVTDLGIRDNI
jgi:small subunit ribosomal protein S15